MRKQTKLVAALSATALLAIGASAVTFAAGWNNSTGNWQYLDNEGTPIADAWRKSGDYWFYLGSDGNMATNEVVQNNNDFYYVNQDGAMVTNQWVAFDVESDDANADHRWMYFGADGKAYRDGNGKLTISDIRTINGKKYLFDQEGYMLYGWLGDDSTLVIAEDAWETAKYYYGGFDDGSAQYGWVQLPVLKDGDEVVAWFYIDGNGKIVKNTKKTINGQTYFFGADGRMIEDWSNLKKDGGSPSEMKPATASSNQIVYVNGDGSARKNQWVWAVPTYDLDPDDYENDTASWWWADASGKVAKGGIKRIKNKLYAFDSLGRMVSGLQTSGDGRTNFKAVEGSDLAVYLMNTSLAGKNIYYFSGDAEKDGSRKIGYQTVSFDDMDAQMYFNNNGKAAHGYVAKIKKYANKGVVLAADNDESNYGYVELGADIKSLATSETVVSYFTTRIEEPTTAQNKVLVNSSGTVQKNKVNLKDVNDVYYVTDREGKVAYADYKKLYTSSTTEHGHAVSILGKTFYTE